MSRAKHPGFPGEVFTDYFSVTVPIDSADGLMDQLLLTSHMAGATEVDSRTLAFPLGGTVRHEPKAAGRVYYVGVSGDAVRSLQAAEEFGWFLSAIGCHPHRVTRLDAAQDFTGGDSRPFLQDTYRRAKSGQIRLTRKATAVNRLLSPSVYDDGQDTGTVYLGRMRSPGIAVRAYDKRQQMMQAKGSPDPGHHWTRVELQAGRQVEKSLRDVMQPAPFFWHHLSGTGILPIPPGMEKWVSSEGFADYDLPARPQPTVAMRIDKILENSQDFQQLVKLANDMPHGAEYLIRKIARKLGLDPADILPVERSEREEIGWSRYQGSPRSKATH